MITFACRNVFLKVDKKIFCNLIEPFVVLTVSVKFYLTQLSAVACSRFTCIPVYMLSNIYMMKLTDIFCAGC